MAQKWTLQDIKPNASRRVRAQAQTQPPERLKTDIARPIQKAETPVFTSDPDLSTLDIIDGNQEKRRRIFVISSITLFILIAGLGISTLLGGATLMLTPKTKDVSVQATFTASKAAMPGALSYELLSLESTAEKQVQAKGREQVSERSSGKIFVYNTKSTAPQRLIKNTRFESPEGFIYRIKESIEVPGAKEGSDGVLEPGTAVADVFADKTGDAYNLAPTRFTVPGLKDTDQYESVYAESKTQFVGGFEGEKYIIDDAELQTAEQALSLELRDSLLKTLEGKKPAGFILYNDAITFTYEKLPATEYTESLATIKMKATLHVPIFQSEQFANFIAKQSIPDYKGEPVAVTDPQTLTFSYSSSTFALGDISTSSNIDFILKGSTQLVWIYNAEALKNDLLGRERADSAAIFATYPAISNASADVRPFWQDSFPDDIDKITIVDAYAKE